MNFKVSQFRVGFWGALCGVRMVLWGVSPSSGWDFGARMVLGDLSQPGVFWDI